MSATSTTISSQTSTAENAAHRGRSLFFITLSTTLVVATLFLIFMGALVTSHGAGLAVPDWPTTFGENMFTYHYSKWVGGVFYEHVHRLIASGIGMLTVILALWASLYEQRSAVRVLVYLALIAVILQGLLGGLTVLYQLPLLVSSSHAALGQTFLIMTILLAVIARIPDGNTGFSSHIYDTEAGRSISRLSLSLLALLYLQLIVAALMRHSESGLAIPDFPLMGGNILPNFAPQTIETINAIRFDLGLRDVTQPQVLVHFAHRLLGVCLILAYSIFLFRIIKGRAQIPPSWISAAKVLSLFVAIQFILGAFAIWSVRDPIITSAHVVCGAALLGGTALFFFRTLPLHRYFGSEQ